jgi:nucleoside-diphosphate-sugar epimerase
VIGPWDQNLLQMFQTVKRGWNLIGISKHFQYSFVHVADLASGILEVVNRGFRLSVDDRNASRKLNQTNYSKGIYFIADPNPITFAELGNYVSKSMDISQPRHVVVPRIICKSVAMFSEIGGRYLGMRAYLNLDKIREAEAGSWFCDTSRAHEELGYRVEVPLNQRVFETAQWYREHRWI